MTTVANLIALSNEFPQLAAQEMPTGRIRITIADRDSNIWVEYYAASNVQAGNDPWRYMVSHTTAKTEYVGPYSHVTEKGCWIMAKRYFVENGFIETPDDNSHLSTKTKKIAATAQKNRDSRSASTNSKPETGDFIVDLNGQFRRVCHTSETECQQTTALEHRYSTSESGGACFSGSLGACVSYDDLTKQPAKQPAIFWVFRDGIVGAGRSVDLWLNVTVWEFDGTFGAGLWDVN